MWGNSSNSCNKQCRRSSKKHCKSAQPGLLVLVRVRVRVVREVRVVKVVRVVRVVRGDGVG